MDYNYCCISLLRCVVLRTEYSIEVIFAGRPPASDQHPGERDRDPAQVPRGQRESALHGKGPLLQDLRLARQSYQQVHKSRSDHS